MKSDLRVSEQPDTAENSETKVKRWLIGRDHGKSTCDDNLVKSMTISSMNIRLYSPRTKTKVFMYKSIDSNVYGQNPGGQLNFAQLCHFIDLTSWVRGGPDNREHESKKWV